MRHDLPVATTTDHDVKAPVAGTVIAVAHEPGDEVATGQAIVVLESMKMEHEVLADADGIVRKLDVSVGDMVEEGQLLAVLAARPTTTSQDQGDHPPERFDEVREDLQAVRDRHA